MVFGLATPLFLDVATYLCIYLKYFQGLFHVYGLGGVVF
jgi:hypothetical protein